MSWKYKIGILYGSFVVMILSLVFMAYVYTGKVQLVDENYYQKELKYQKIIDARNRGTVYQNAIHIKQNSEQLFFEYPLHLREVKVRVEGYCLSDASKDFKGALQEPISKVHLRKGPYKIALGWGKEPLDTLVELSTFIE